MTSRYAVLGALAVLGGVALGWRVWTASPPVPEPAVPAAGGQTNQTPSPSPISSAPVAAPVQPAPAPDCPDCGDLPADPRLAEVARRSDFYQGYAERLRTETASELVRQWPDVVARDDPDELPAFLGVLAQALRESDDAALYLELAGILHDPQASASAKSAVLILLGRTATPQATQVLTDYLASGSAKDGVEGTLRESLREAAATLVDGHWNWDISPVLETARRGRDPDLAEADRAVLAQGIATLSTADGARALLETLNAAAAAGHRDRAIALAALGSLERNEAVPALEEALAGSPSDPGVTAAAMGALVNIGSADAYLGLIGYLSRVQALDVGQLETLRAEMLQRGLSDEAAKVVREAVDHQAFADAAAKGLLADLLASE